MTTERFKRVGVALAATLLLMFIAWAQLRARPDEKPAEKSRDADAAVIRQSATEFAEAFNKGDAKAIASMFTDDAECRIADGRTFVGRAAIEKAYADFFKSNPGTKIEVLVKSIRFPAKDMAVEEGLARQVRGPKDLPQSTPYVAIHIREDGKWKMALAAEGEVGQSWLEDLDWLLGDWETRAMAETVKFSFARDPKKHQIIGTFTSTPSGKEPVSGSIRIAVDPETGQIRSWGFEDDGSHSQALWSCDGKSWILDCRGVLADGAPTAERIILKRAAPDVITWRSIDRVVADTVVADTPPLRLTRIANSK
jgi:uncharacterized protein (TIGR02246 family)